MDPSSLILQVIFLSLAFPINGDKIFSVVSYGAVADNRTDNSQAFMRAWIEACQWRDKSVILIPSGAYYLNAVVFRGPCNGATQFLIKGNLTAPSDPRIFFIDHWITFQHVSNLRIDGGGTLDGQGAVAWPYRRCAGSLCPRLPVSLRLDFVNDSEITNIRSVNSKNFHINLFACRRVGVTRLTISAPGDSPNTDGVHVAASVEVHVDSAEIATGDDCVSIGPGCAGVRITNVRCGPGHGISVGSLGRAQSLETVSNVSVSNCTLRRTMNGVQIKTWPDPAAAGGSASGFLYDGIVMEDVGNPIFINQQYCPHNLCNPKESSKIQISNITFMNIQGTSATKDAVNINCSKSNPCQNIFLKNINLTGSNGSTVSSLCSNAQGKFEGQQKPPSCLSTTCNYQNYK